MAIIAKVDQFVKAPEPTSILHQERLAAIGD
jgi:hypothetical protein